MSEAAVADDGQLNGIVRRLTDAAARDDHERIARLFNECVPSVNLTPRSAESA